MACTHLSSYQLIKTVAKIYKNIEKMANFAERSLNITNTIEIYKR